MPVQPAEGTVVALLDRLRLQRLPLLLALKDKVDAGGTLDEIDIGFLQHEFDDARDIGPLPDRHPELRKVAAQVAALYRDITAKALDNERRDLAAARTGGAVDG